MEINVKDLFLFCPSHVLCILCNSLYLNNENRWASFTFQSLSRLFHSQGLSHCTVRAECTAGEGLLKNVCIVGCCFKSGPLITKPKFRGKFDLTLSPCIIPFLDA